MQPDRPSSSAEMVASWRALEFLLPADERILVDPHARGFLGAGRRAMLDAAERLPPRALRALIRRIDRVLHGIMTFVVARQRALDELLCAGSFEQVVLLGTGYDSRACRLAARLEGVHLFEVDHPATAARRASLLEAAFGPGPRLPTTSVDVDFQRESLEERLLESGFDPARPTFWCWEGVSMYLDLSAVEQTLSMVARRSPPGSILGFDVWTPPQEGVLQKLALRDLPTLAMGLVHSEPFQWGPRPDDLDPLLRAHGLALLEIVPAPELVRRYQPKHRVLFDRSSSLRLCVAEVDRPLD